MHEPSTLRRARPGTVEVLERHVRTRLATVEAALLSDLPGVADAAWDVLGSGRPLPTIVRTTFEGYGGHAERQGLLGAYDHVTHTIRLNVEALALGALLRRHRVPAGRDRCWAELGEELHPGAVLEPLAMTLVHELVHAATWRDEGRGPGASADPDPAPADGTIVRWPLYEQTLTEVDGRVVGSPVDPRRRALLEGITDARASQVLASIDDRVPAWLALPARDAVRAAHPRADLVAYGARPVVELLCTAPEIATLLDGPADWHDLCGRALARMGADEALVARGWLSGELDRFVADSGLAEDHPFRRVGWRSIAAWISLGDAATAS